MNLNGKKPFSVLHLRETDSTNTYLKQICERESVEEFTTVVADFQRTGRGQTGNSWEAEDNKNLLFSFILYPNFCLANKQFYLSQLVSLAVKETLDQYADGFSIKWPNDIYWHDKKICGMLIENELYGNYLERCMPGIGININQTRFVSDAPNPVSLAQITGKEYDKESIMIEILLRAHEYYQMFKEQKIDVITTRYLDSLYRKNGMYRYQDEQGEFIACIKGILPVGTLILCDEKGEERRYNFKEVAYIRD